MKNCFVNEDDQVVVKISDMKFSKRKTDVLVTYSLGSCLGVTAYDPINHIGALMHALLPSSKVSTKDADFNPYMFVNTGLRSMVQILFRLGAKKDNLIFKVAGGANMRGDTLFNTGSRNCQELNNILDKNSMKTVAQDVGGTVPRTMYLFMDTGKVVVKSYGKETVL